MGFLHGVLGGRGVPQNATGDPEQPSIVPAHESFKGSRIPSPRPLDQQQVREVAQCRSRFGRALARGCGAFGVTRGGDCLEHMHRSFLTLTALSSGVMLCH